MGAGRSRGPLERWRRALGRRRRRAEGARWTRFREDLVDAAALHAMIGEAIRAGRPFAFGRPGYYEAWLVAHGFATDGPTRHRGPWAGPRYPDWLRRVARDNVGIERVGDAELDAFVATTLGAIAACDALGVVDEPVPGFTAVLERVIRPEVVLSAHLVADPRAALDLGARPWTADLAGRRVLVVHPFARSIARQYARRADVTGVRDLLPELDLLTLVPPVTFAGASTGRSWSDELAAACARMAGLEFDVAIVGAGGYGLPLAVHAKALGRVGVHLAGATQVLFGIRGGRWRDDPRIGPEMDATWVDPDPSEVPPDPDRVEAGAYW